MNLQTLSVFDLQCLVSVAEHRSFGQAAVACNITQPTLSDRIKRIEALLSVSIFDRNKRATTTTPQGALIVTKAKELLQQVAELGDIVSTMRRPLDGQLRLGAIMTIGPYLLPLLLPALRRDHPTLELNLVEGLTHNLVDSMLAGTLDVIISSVLPRDAGLTEIAVFEEPFLLAAPADHDFASRPVAAEELDASDMVLLEDGHCLTGQALDICPMQRRTRNSGLHVATLDSLRHMVAAGVGYSLMPKLAVEAARGDDRVHYNPLKGAKQYGREIVVAYRDDSRRADAELLAEMIRAAVTPIL